ncbi:MAG: SRPBCC domain-containing protein [Bacteroidetes bacterium]|nr:SRPBCC domain-containing protein [Bacteroidota bacterium]
MENLNWNQFIKKIYIKTSIEDLYKYWATQEGIEKWFLKSANYTSKDGTKRSSDDPVRQGDEYVWEWHNFEYLGKGEIIEANGTNHLAFTFEGSTVSIDLSSGRDMTLIALTQSNIREDEESKMKIYNGCSNGWTFFLANLKAIAEHNISLVDTKPDLNMGDGLEWVNV